MSVPPKVSHKRAGYVICDGGLLEGVYQLCGWGLTAAEAWSCAVRVMAERGWVLLPPAEFDAGDTYLGRRCMDEMDALPASAALIAALAAGDQPDWGEFRGKVASLAPAGVSWSYFYEG